MESIARVAPLSGLIFALLFAAGSAIWGFDQPVRDAETEELVSFYEDTSTRILIGGTLSLVSLPFLVWFGAVLRENLATAEAPERTGLAPVAFAGTIVAAAVGLGAETINMAGALSADDGRLSGDTAQAYFDISWAFGAPAAGLAFSMIAAPIGVIAQRTGALVRPWTAWLALLVTLGFLTPLMLTPAYRVPYVLVLVLLGWFSIRLYRDSR